VLLEIDLPIFAVDPVRRILAPQLQDDVDRLEHHLRTRFRYAEVEHLEVAGETAGADAHDEASADEVIEHRGVRRHRGGMQLGQVDDAGAERDLLRAAASVARKISGEVMRSLHELKCSPTNTSLKPSWSASTIASWSSSRMAP
jgi:hypothetical protein